jgi:hypothetical protein
MATALVAGAAATAIVIVGALKLTKSKQSPKPAAAAISERSAELATLPVDPMDFASAQWPSMRAEARPRGARLMRGAPLEPDGLLREKTLSSMGDYDYVDTASAGFQDQQWNLDCGHKTTCPFTPHSSVRSAPMENQHLGNTSETLGDYVSGAVRDTGRDASGELNETPHPTRRYADSGMGWGEPLESTYIPYGGHEATDLQFWGPTDWNAERNSRLPSYLHNRELELDGKEINRPMNQYFSDFSPDDGSTPVEFSGGYASGRTADVRLQGLNRYWHVATTKRADENLMFLPPTQNGKTGSMPPLMPEMSFGARVVKAFNAFKPWRDMGKRGAPPIAAAIQLPPSTRNPQNYEERVGNPTPYTASYGSEGVNSAYGGRPNRVLEFNDWMRGGNLPPGGAAAAGLETNPMRDGVIRRIAGQWDTFGNPGFKITANAGTELNPPDGGYHYTTRERILSDSETANGRTPSNGGWVGLLHNSAAGARGRKDNTGRAEYQAPGGSKQGQSQWGGAGVVGQFQALHALPTWALPRGGISAGGGTGGATGTHSMWTLHGNVAKATTWSDEPPVSVGDAANNPMQASILNNRTAAELSDVLDVEHS